MSIPMLVALCALALFATGAFVGWLLRGSADTAERELGPAMEVAAARGELDLRDDWFNEDVLAGSSGGEKP